ncbi:craniofacial development protein 1-like isoform 1-T1 [Salvelinus alpinus]|uniref:craniofacial development protein 1-like isoform X1 n=1 Tax=Salvelinus alpinus TaxID=8036 RepID=UPI0039FC7FDE
MNYSDYDSDGYSSNADQDYVPSDDNLSEDDMNQCVKEDGLEEVDDSSQQSDNVTKKKKKKGQDIGMRKRKKGGLKLEETEQDGRVEEQEQEGEEGEFSDSRPKKEVDEEKKKKKADDLWASFLSDVGPKSKPSIPSPQSTTKQQAAPTDRPKKSTAAPSERHHLELKPKEPSKVTITKVFDFAGEEVRVTKEVDADSKEAKCFLKSKEETPDVRTIPSRSEHSSLAPGPRGPACSPHGHRHLEELSTLPGDTVRTFLQLKHLCEAQNGSHVKRPAGMGSILNRLGGKKQKMSTLEKSKMDWDAFKDEEGIGDELAIHNRGKEGYVEKKNFLQRVDHRQFEQEKKVRLSNIMKR